MSPLLPERPDGFGPWLPETVRVPDRERDRDRYFRRWQLKAAQWRALDLAQHVFGGEAQAALEGSAGPGPFRGLLRLSVPFGSLEEHRRKEETFSTLAGRDPVLDRHPLVYVFDPRPPAGR